ncbi:MAG: exopolysaccharide biosynthesis polyprenyl glycosylphosphotransferase [Lachnospiraceae bacterium]|nr:exopolysaccharide biosynthesis polyprenyl glycosylphosphotransferase [Lachnospiraceae bacterium]
MTDKKLEIEWKYIYRGMCAVILTAIAGGSFFYVWHKFVYFYAANYQRYSYLRGKGNQLMSLTIYLALYILIGHGLRAFAIGVERVSNILASQVITLFMTDICETFVSMAIAGRWRYWWHFLWKYLRLFALQSVVICIIAILMIRLYRMLFPPIDIIEIYGRKNGLYGKVNKLQYKYHISESLFAEKLSLEEVTERIREHQAVLLNDLPAQKRNKILKTCFSMDKRVYVVPKISDVIMKNSEDLRLFDTPMLLCRNHEISWWQRIVKRGFDILLSLIALILLSPVMLITAIAIHAEDGGPVLYMQERVTRGGKRFQMLKFRSMIVNAEADGRPHPAGEKDPRITRTGNIIRACRIDELPQLINILRGDMSIVGPRPERVEHVEKYSKLIPEFEFRLKMKGGLTGYAQVYGKYNTPPLDKLKLDLTYITNYSLVTDVQIIFETLKILFLKESTEGFEEPSTVHERKA